MKNGKILTCIIFLLCLSLVYIGCFNPTIQDTGTSIIPSDSDDSHEESQNKEISSINLLKKVTIQDSRRPKIAATDNRVFIVYAGISERSYNVKIYDREMETEISSKILVTGTIHEGNPTDIRITSDSEYLYAFYEMVDNMQRKTYLFGAKYRLDDQFERTGYTGLIATSKPIEDQQEGDEKLDDPIPLIGDNSVFVMTRYYAPIDSSKETRYKVYEFTKDLVYVREFDLDLSSVADGGARQASAKYHDNHYYMVLPTTVGQGTNEFETPADILLIKFDIDWNIIESHILSTEHDNVERYMTGFEIERGCFFLAFNVLDNFGASLPLKIYDVNYRLILHEILVQKNGVPDIEVLDNRILIGLSSGHMGDEELNSDVYVYEIIRA